jgi:pimeloyl-ACP methyl ester carboxylesterase
VIEDRRTETRRHVVAVRGVRSPVLEAGPQDATSAVVFVHGNPGVAEDWLALLEPVGAFGRAVAVTMPGFGDADKPDGFDYTVDGYARHLDGVVRQLDLQHVHLVLHDFGGPWGLEWAARHPDRHASTTLINTGVILRESWHALARVWRTPVLGELFFRASTRSGMRQFMKRTNPPTFPQSYADHLFDLYQDPGTRRAVLQLYRATPIRPHADALAPRLREHPHPTLVVWGAKDPYLKVRLAARQREVFGSSTQIQILERSGHWPLADAPDAVIAAALPFLRVQLAP